MNPSIMTVIWLVFVFCLCVAATQLINRVKARKAKTKWHSKEEAEDDIATIESILKPGYFVVLRLTPHVAHYMSSWFIVNELVADEEDGKKLYEVYNPRKEQ